jgi:hypothetical protein
MSPTPECYRAKGLMRWKWRLANWRVEMQLAELGLESWNKRAWSTCLP